MADIFRVKLRRIGTSVGALIPQEQLKAAEVDVGDEVDLALLKHRTPNEIKRLVGIAKHAGPFVRDKKTREF